MVVPDLFDPISRRNWMFTKMLDKMQLTLHFKETQNLSQRQRMCKTCPHLLEVDSRCNVDIPHHRCHTHPVTACAGSLANTVEGLKILRKTQ